MKILIRLSLVIMAPYLLVLYWRNSLREIGDIHANYELEGTFE